MKMKEKLNLANYDAKHVDEMDDLTLRNIIYQVHGEWNSCLTREDLEIIAIDALGEEAEDRAQAEADKYIDFHHGGD